MWVICTSQGPRLGVLLWQLKKVGGSIVLVQIDGDGEMVGMGEVFEWEKSRDEVLSSD